MMRLLPQIVELTQQGTDRQNEDETSTSDSGTDQSKSEDDTTTSDSGTDQSEDTDDSE